MSKESIEIANLMLSKDPENHALADALLIGQTAGLSELETKTLCVDICDHFFRTVGVDKFFTDIVQNGQIENDRILTDDCYSKYICLSFELIYCYTLGQHPFLYGCMEATIRFRFSKKRKFKRLTIDQKHAFFRTSLKHKTNILGFVLFVFANIGSGYRLGGGKTRDLKKVKNSYLEFVKKAAKDLQNHISSLLPLKTVKHARKIY